MLPPALLGLALAAMMLPPSDVSARPGGVRRDPGPRAEHFVLELRDAQDALPRRVGTACIRRRALPSGYQLEAEWTFDRSDDEGGGERVLHVERIEAAGSRMIWREWGPTRARSLTVDRDARGTSFSALDSARGSSRREAIAARAPATFPLELIERIRAGAALDLACERFDPLARSLERVEVRCRPVSAGPRVVEIVRADGTLAGRYELEGDRLVAFAFQDGGLVARRVSEGEAPPASGASVSIQR